MSRYFDAADAVEIEHQYPIGDAFLSGPAQLSRDELGALRERRFLSLVARGWQVPFYLRRWGDAGLEPEDIRRLDDVAKLPPYSKADLMDSIAAHPPFGDFHGLDFSDPARANVVLHTTSGTTGEPQPLFFGAFDREVQNALLARAYTLQGLRDDDVVHATYGFGMVNGGHYIREAILHFTNALLLPAGTGAETRSQQQVRLMQRFGATVLVGFADFLKRLGQVAKEAGVEASIRMISGHLGQEDPGELSALWGGAEVFDWYGVGDTGVVAAEGPTHDGLHVFEDAHIVEILNPESAAPLPPEQPGNICITTLFKRDVYPVIRFNTHDVSAWLPGTGASRIGFRRLAGFRGRSDSMVKLRGINVYPTAIGKLLKTIDGLTGEFICRVSTADGRDEMLVVAESDRLDDHDSPEKLGDLLRERIGVAIAVALVPPGATAADTELESRQKPIRLIDER